MQENEQTASRNTTSTSLLKISLVVLFLLLFLISLIFVYDENEVKVRSEMNQQAAAFVQKITENLHLSVENLHAISSFFVYFENVNFTQFEGMTERKFESDPGLLILEWQPVVPGEEREQFVAEARLGGQPDFRLWEPDENNQPVNARRRKEHVPVYFMRARSLPENEPDTVGLDLAWSDERMQSKWEARDTGIAQASELFLIKTGKSSNYSPLGFAVTLPIYKRGFVPATTDERRKELLGYMAGVYSIEALLKDDLDRLAQMGLNVVIHDDRDDDHRLIAETGKATELSHKVVFDLVGNKLHLKLNATERFFQEQFELLWLALPLSFFAFGVLIFLFFQRIESNNKQLATAQSELQSLNTQLELLSRIDDLTGLLNRRAFSYAVVRELERLDRYKLPVALLMLDLDYFKKINDKWGHHAGDVVLKEFTAVCQRLSRNSDTVARVGGEEFAILLLNTNSEQAWQFAQRLRQEVAELRISLPESKAEITVTVSIGISSIESVISPEKWQKQADKALYLAKNSGRNCVKAFLQ